jgi:hypothetical protein
MIQAERQEVQAAEQDAKVLLEETHLQQGKEMQEEQGIRALQQVQVAVEAQVEQEHQEHQQAAERAVQVEQDFLHQLLVLRFFMQQVAVEAHTLQAERQEELELDVEEGSKLQ